MKIWLIIDQLSSLYARQWLGNDEHEYLIYRDQLHQYSSHTTISNHHQIMKKGINYLIDQWVDHIICPPTIELHYQQQYPKILPIFQQYIAHTTQHSIVGKIGFIWSATQCQDINLHRWDITSQHQATSKQVSNRHYNNNLPIWTSIDLHLTHRLLDHKPDHFIINHTIKWLIRPLKNAAVDTIIWLDRAYYACDVSLTHHCRGISRHRSDILKQIFSSSWSLLKPLGVSWSYSITIHHTGTLHDLEQNKKLQWLLAKGQNYKIHQIKID